MNKIYQIKGFFLFKNIFRALLVCIFISSQSFSAKAQCPPNIDFELGSFTGWECWIGHTFADPVAGKNIISWDVPPINTPVSPSLYPSRFTMYSMPGNARDAFGNFPVNCPNGSGHSVKLGNTQVKIFRIFNRAGQLLFEDKRELPGWDGNFKGSPQAQQTVVWMVGCIGLDGAVHLQNARR